MENYKKGGYEKRYTIRKIVGRRIDGRAITKACDPDADYFVLRLDKDPHARKALVKYAKSVESDNPRFAGDLWQVLGGYDIYKSEELNNE